MRELDSTAAAAADDRFEEILKRVKAAGADMIEDVTTPLFIDSMGHEVEIGETRLVEFNLKQQRMDFQITRQTRWMRFVGEGNGRHLEKMSRPMIDTKLKRKAEMSDQWIGVDIDDMF